MANAGTLSGAAIAGKLRVRVGDYSVTRAEANARDLSQTGRIRPEDRLEVSDEGWARLREAKERRFQGELRVAALEKALGFKQKDLTTGQWQAPKFDQRLLDSYAAFRLGNYLEDNGYVIEALRVTA